MSIDVALMIQKTGRGYWKQREKAASSEGSLLFRMRRKNPVR